MDDNLGYMREATTNSFLPLINNILGQTDLHYSKETMLPAWYSYAMRKRAPYKEVLNKWC